MNIALIAHDAKKELLVQFCIAYCGIISRHEVCATNTPGLDVAHMGIAFYADSKLLLVHASSTDKKVVVSKVPLSQMLKDNNKWTGIRVLRMKK